MGRTKRVILLSILLFSSRHRNVTGNVAELKRQVNWSDYKKPSKHKPFSFEMLQAKAENEDGRIRKLIWQNVVDVIKFLQQNISNIWRHENPHESKEK